MEASYIHQTSDRKFSDLYLCYCGYDECASGHSFGPAVRPNYLLHYILKGKGQYHIGEKRYHLSAGQGFLIFPQIQTFYQADTSDPWTYIWVGFDGNSASQYLQDIGLTRQHPTFQCSYADELKQTVLHMLNNNTSAVMNQFLSESLIYSFFSILSRDISTVIPTQLEEENLYVRRAVEFIQDNYSLPIHVTDIANYVCINRSYLYTLFRKYLGVSPQEYLANYRITHAAELLRLTDLSIESVAFSCGYTDALVFSKTFKTHMGQTPSRYRKESRQTT